MIEPVTTAPESLAIDEVTSKDGTTIGYRRLGSGPGVVVLHGAMESSRSHVQLAEALADAFTVYLPDRRGRGLSGPYAAGHTVATDIADMDALLAKTGAQLVFGVSSGSGGLGWFIYENKNQLQIPSVFAGLFSVILIGLLVENFIFRIIERRTVRRWGMQA